MYRYGDMYAKKRLYIRYDMGIYQIIYWNYCKTIIICGVWRNSMRECLDWKLFWMYPNGKYILGNNDYFPCVLISAHRRKWRIILHAGGGYFWPEKPTNRGKTGVVHPPTPHPPILPPSVSKFTYPNIHPSTIPTLQQKSPNCLCFLPII